MRMLYRELDHIWPIWLISRYLLLPYIHWLVIHILLTTFSLLFYYTTMMMMMTTTTMTIVCGYSMRRVSVFVRELRTAPCQTSAQQFVPLSTPLDNDSWRRRLRHRRHFTSPAAAAGHVLWLLTAADSLSLWLRWSTTTTVGSLSRPVWSSRTSVGQVGQRQVSQWRHAERDQRRRLVSALPVPRRVLRRPLSAAGPVQRTTVS